MNECTAECTGEFLRGDSRSLFDSKPFYTFIPELLNTNIYIAQKLIKKENKIIKTGGKQLGNKG